MVRIFVASDFHYCEEQHDEAIAIVDGVIERANALGCDLLVGLGDLYDVRTSRLQEEPLDVHRRFEAHVDVQNLIRSRFERFKGKHGFITIFDHHETPAWIQMYTQGYRYKFQLIDNILILACQCCDNENRMWGYIGARQLADLRRALADNPDAIPILMAHRNLEVYTGVVEGGAEDIRVENYCLIRNADAVRTLYNTHTRATLIVSAHIWPASSGYYTDGLGLVHVRKRHTSYATSSPFYTLRDQWIIDVDPPTGAIDVDVWRFDYNDRLDVWSGTV